MQKLTLEKLKELPSNHKWDLISDKLKDPKEFKVVEKKIATIMYSDHKHKDIKGYIKCNRCQAKFQKKREYIKNLGFHDIEEYQKWKKIMQIIINPKPLVLYAKK